MIFYGLMGALVLLLLILVVCLSFLINYARKELRHQKIAIPSKRPISANSLDTPPKSQSIPVRPQNSQPQALRRQEQRLLRRLLTMLGGDQNTAHRLLAAIKKKFPDQANEWHLEKVISDLERDRRY